MHMQMKLYNSLTKKIEDFTPALPSDVRIYSCGPTVYDYAHIGNMRAFVFADLLQRTLRTVGGYKVKWVMNITDIDDKTIRGSRESAATVEVTDARKRLRDFTARYLEGFKEDIETLGISLADFAAMPRATDHIGAMQDLILKIAAKGFAYERGGSIYFDVMKWREADTYGKLKKIDFDNFRSDARIDADEYEKENVSDFVLWKGLKEGEPFWDFDFRGTNVPGRPGWHIECSAMEYELLGLPFDIHTGGVDLQFPHHEDEIAQSKAGYGIDPANFWCHNAFLEVEGQKMSKSLGNFFTLRDLAARGLDPKDIRYAMLAAHYRSTYNFTFADVQSGRKARLRIQEAIYALFEEGADMPAVESGSFALRESVFAELADDLHTPKALAHIFTYLNKTKISGLPPGEKSQLLSFFRDFESIFNVFDIGKRKEEEKTEIPAEVISLAEQRLAAKKEKDWSRADELRKRIADSGYILKDTKDGYELEPAG